MTSVAVYIDLNLSKMWVNDVLNGYCLPIVHEIIRRFGYILLNNQFLIAAMQKNILPGSQLLDDCTNDNYSELYVFATMFLFTSVSKPGSIELFIIFFTFYTFNIDDDDLYFLLDILRKNMYFLK
jgi:hypothetical protein